MTSRSIRNRLVTLSVAATAAALAVASALIVGHAWGEARRDLLDRLDSTAAVVGASCTAALAFGDTAAAHEALESAAKVPGTLEAVLYARDGSAFAEFRAGGVRGAPPPRAAPPAGRRLARGSAEVVTPVRLDGAVVGSVYLRATTEPIEARLARAALAAAVAASAALAVAAWFLARFITALVRPVLELSALTDDVSARGDYAVRAPVRGRDELARLARGMNRMLEAVEQRDRALEAHRQRLEQEVSARTADLAATNARLEAELVVRHRAETALVRAAQHWRATFDSIRGGVCVLDRDLRVVHANGWLHELLAAAPGALEGRELVDVLRPLLGEAAPAAVADEESAVHQAGDRWFEVRRDRIGGADGGEVAGYVELVSDVTRQHALQTQLLHAQRMEAVGRLAGGVAHDFNNLLSVILTYASSLAEELPDEEQRAQAAEIERAGQRAADLTRRLLAFSRKQVLRPEVLPVAGSIRDIAKMIGRLIGEHIQLSVELGESVGHVRMDPSQLEQVVVNLAVNARDAMPDGGRLTIEARDVDVAGGGALPPGPYVRIRVSDTGVGMDEATLARIFEPFFTTKPKGKGTGLGLAMVYGAVQQSEGAIDAASEVGVGTSFTVHLPRVAAPAVAAEEESAPAPRGRGERVLVVEDEPQVRATIRRFLVAGGYDVAEAANGDEGLAAFREARYDVVLTDLVMPGTGGIALGRAIGALGATPVLYMSGYSEEVVSGKERIPAERFVQKPFDRRTLLQRVAEAVGRPV